MKSNSRYIFISISEQVARLMQNNREIASYSVSSAANGTGFEINSNKTPTGRFRIYKKIGDGCPKGTIFKDRLTTGDICGENPRSAHWQSKEDLVLSRILWLEGIEQRNANTLERFIYIHGTNQEYLIGKPVSHGCIRMKNDDVIGLFELVEEGTEVKIIEGASPAAV